MLGVAPHAQAVGVGRQRVDDLSRRVPRPRPMAIRRGERTGGRDSVAARTADIVTDRIASVRQNVRLAGSRPVRMYLSSFRLGDRPELLLELLSGEGPVAVVANAMDAAPADVRTAAVERELADLTSLGLDAVELDLRAWRDTPEGLSATLADHRLLWVRGGNTFVLRVALARSGADVVVRDLIARDALVYAGYSAGCCVLAPSLRGLELVDPPGDVIRAYGVEAMWEGLRLISHAIVPHFRSDHPEAELVETLHAYYVETGVPHRTLSDGDALVIDERPFR